MLALLNLATLLLRCTAAFFRSHNEQAIVELTLRQQLATYTVTGSNPNITPLDRALWVALSRFWPRWKDTLVIVKPDTVIRWHRKGFRLYWRAISKRVLEGRRSPRSCRRSFVSWQARTAGARARFKRSLGSSDSPQVSQQFRVISRREPPIVESNSDG